MPRVEFKLETGGFPFIDSEDGFAMPNPNYVLWLESRLQTKDELIEALNAYILFLEIVVTGSSFYLQVHGQGATETEIKAGIELREKINTLKNKTK